MAQPGVDPIKYKGAWWSRDGHTILKWANEEWQPWAQETDEGEPPPRLVFESKQAAQGIEWADRAQEPNAGVSAVVSQARAAREAGTKIFQITHFR